MGQVSFLFELQTANRAIKVLTLLKEKKQGSPISSRLLSRALSKAGFSNIYQAHTLEEINQLLKERYTDYYKVKKDHVAKWGMYLENLAEALALENNTSQQKNSPSATRTGNSMIRG
jgi:hypothetical protein